MAKKTTKKSSPTPKKPSAKKVAKVAKPKIALKAAAKPAKTSAKTPVKTVVKSAARKPIATKAATTPTRVKPVRTQPVVENKPAVPAEKVKSVLGRRDLEKFRDLLLIKRRELLGDVNSMEDEALRNSGNTNLSNLPIHMADMGTDNYEQEFTLGLVEKDRKVLREIHIALMKINEGTYGICEGTGKPISKARLEAQPWTRYSIEHARKLEQRRV